MAVVDGHAPLVFLHAIEQHELFLGVLHLDHRMSVAEGSPFAILTAHPHIEPVQQKAAVGHEFGHSPIEGIGFLDHLFSVPQKSLDLVEELLPLWKCGEPIGDEFEFVFIKRAVRRFFQIDTLGGMQMEILVFEEGCDHIPVDLLGLVVSVLQQGFEFAFQLLDNIGPDHTFLLEFFCIQAARVRVFGDGLVEQWLRETWLISFVVPVFAVAKQIDEHITIVALSVFGRKEHRMNDGLDIVSIHVQYRREHHFSNIRTVGRGTRIEVIRGESDLIVDHNVDGASGLVSVEGFHLHDLIHNTLACNRCISMNEDGQNLSRLGTVFGIDPGSADAFHHAIHSLQMRGIGAEIEPNPLAVGQLAFSGVPHVVFYIPVESILFFKFFSFEFTEDLFRTLAKDVAQYVQATAVRHAHDHLLDAQVTRPLDQNIQGRDQAFGTLHGEALLPDEFGVEKSLERDRFIEFSENAFFLIWGEVGMIVILVDLGYDPFHHFPIPDVNEFDANALAIDAQQMGLNFPQAGGCLDPHLFGRHEWPVQVFFTQPVVMDLQRRLVLTPASDRICLGEEVASFSVVIDQVYDKKLFPYLLGDLLIFFAEDFPFFQCKVVTLKKCPPTGLDLIGLFEILLIELFNKADVGTSEKRETMHPELGNCLLLFVRKYNF
ncbi:MAG: Uncharacterised protein [Flavobacteriia bacterium]|nr:MAG: Uncharacterised protein [Flavobacteriia bacterium]